MAKFALALTAPFIFMANQAAPENNPDQPWRAVHLGIGNTNAANQLIEMIPKLAKLGVNVIIAEIDYGFQYKSYPQLARENANSPEQIKRLVDTAKKYNIRLIPQFQCLGHQSWSSNTGPLLTQFPQFDESPNQYPNNEGIYCRSYCPLHPQINTVIFSLMDELIDAFQADALHVGMDEVFIIADPACPRCAGKDKAELFAKAVKDYYNHIVKERKIEMLMWGDRLINAEKYGYEFYEASKNGTDPAIDMIPKDIIICDWHYEPQKSYLSVPLFLEKGFRVLPASWKNNIAAKALIDYSKTFDNPRMIGHLNTTWGYIPIENLDRFEPLRYAAKAFGGASEQYFNENPLLPVEKADLITGAYKLHRNLKDYNFTKPIVSVTADVLKNSINNCSSQWTLDLINAEKNTPALLAASFPYQTVSKPGDGFETEFQITLNTPASNELQLHFFLAEDLDSEQWTEYRFCQLLNNKTVLWELDLATTKTSTGRWLSITLPIETTLNKTQLDLTLRIIDKKGVQNYPTIIYIGPVLVTESNH